jgi:hypothetical protein
MLGKQRYTHIQGSEGPYGGGDGTTNGGGGEIVTTGAGGGGKTGVLYRHDPTSFFVLSTSMIDGWSP